MKRREMLEIKKRVNVNPARLALFIRVRLEILPVGKVKVLVDHKFIKKVLLRFFLSMNFIILQQENYYQILMQNQWSDDVPHYEESRETDKLFIKLL